MTTFVSAKGRAAAIGRLSVSYALGMLVGSSFGGTLSKLYSPAAVGYLAAALSVGMAAATLLLLSPRAIPLAASSAEEDEDKDNTPQSDSTSRGSAGEGVNLMAAVHMCLRPALLPVVTAVTVMGLATSVHRSQLSVVLADQFGLDAEASGRITALGALMGLLANTVGVSALRARFSERQLLVGSIAMLATCFAAFALCSEVWQLIAVLVPMSLCSTVLYTVSSALLSNAVADEEAGTAVSISHSVRSATGVVAPTLGGYLLTVGGVPAVGAGAALLTAAALPLAMRHARPQEDKRD